MKQIEFLFFRYYKSQCRLGNSDIAPFSAILIISFSIMLYYFSAFFYIITILPDIEINKTCFTTITFLFLFFLIILFYLLLVYKGKYKKIIKSHENELFNKFSVWPILIPLMGFILFNVGWILKMLQNQGRF